MNSTYLYYIFSRKETKLFLFCTLTGGLLQLLSSKYIKNHPEFLEEPEIMIKIKNPSGEIEQITSEITKEPIIRRIIKRIRGGGKVPEKLLELLLRIMLKKLIKLAAKKGLEIGLSLGIGSVFVIFPKKALAKIIEESLPQHLLNKKSFIQVNGDKIYLESCEEGFKYLVAMLMTPEIPFSEKQRLVSYLLRVELDTNTVVLCLFPILMILSTQNPASYFLLLQNLIQALKDGKISKKLAKILVRRLLKNGKLVDPELIDLLNE